MRETDSVIVGSGAGGAVAAWELARAGRAPLLLEEGSECADPKPEFSTGELLAYYRNGGFTAALGKPNIPYIEARGYGGGSLVNAGIFVRAPETVLREWDASVGGFDSAAFASLYSELETRIGAGIDSSGDRIGSTLEKAANALGIEVAYAPRTWRGARRTLVDSLLRPAENSGCSVLRDARATRIVRASGAWDVEYRDSTGAQRVRAKNIFLAAGALQTPLLLRRSGFRRGIGAGLALHPTLKLIAVFPERISEGSPLLSSFQMKCLSPQVNIGCSVVSKETLAVGLCDNAYDFRNFEQEWARMAIFYVAIRGGARGRVRAAPLYGEAMVHYQLSTEEIAHFSEGMAILSRLLFAAGTECVYPSIKGSGAANGPAELERTLRSARPRDLSLSTFHLFSTCAMGGVDARSPCDRFGNLRGASGIRIVDASALPSATGVNPQATIMAVAARNIRDFLKK